MFKNLFNVSFTGRISGKDYWLTFVAFIMLAVLFSVVFTEIARPLAQADVELFAMLLPLPMLVIVGYFSVVSLSLLVRRLHDTNKSGLLILLGLIPFFGAIILFIFSIIPGDKHDNKYGSAN